MCDRSIFVRLWRDWGENLLLFHPLILTSRWFCCYSWENSFHLFTLYQPPINMSSVWTHWHTIGVWCHYDLTHTICPRIPHDTALPCSSVWPCVSLFFYLSEVLSDLFFTEWGHVTDGGYPATYYKVRQLELIILWATPNLVTIANLSPFLLSLGTQFTV